jgi:hypothetical protein
MATAGLAVLPGGDVERALVTLSTHESGVGRYTANLVRFLLWRATHDRVHLAEAKRSLDSLLSLAPPQDRESMRRNVRLNREILEAAADEGL